MSVASNRVERVSQDFAEQPPSVQPPAAGAPAVEPAPGGANGWPNGEVPWQRVSPSYAWADLAVNLIFVLILAVAAGVAFVAAGDELPLLPKLALPALALILLINALLAFRRVRAIGYILREDDLLFRRGIMFERIVAVPYGRLQLVDINRGPLLRALGLSTLKFVTASAATGVQLPGLKEADAEALRDRLVSLAETRRSGL